MPIDEVFKDIASERKDGDEVSFGVTEREIFEGMGLSFKNSKSLEGLLWADLAQIPDEVESDM